MRVSSDKYYCHGLKDIATDIGLWRNRKAFKTSKDNIPEKLALIHSEVSEALEATRKGDDAGFEEELADVIIRVLDLADALDLNMAVAIRDKMIKNESRSVRHGKRF